MSAPNTSTVIVDAPTFEHAVLRMLRPRGGSRPWPKKALDRWVLLFCASRRLRPAEMLSEREANGRLQDWLLGPGDRLETDFVTLRRALIDEGFWDRDAGGTRYRLARRHEPRVRFDTGLPDEVELLAGADTAAANRAATSSAREGRSESGPPGA